MSTTYRELKESLIERRRLQKVKTHYSALLERYKQESLEVEGLSKILEKERHDVEKLEKGGVRNMFYKILGDKEKQLEKERQEYLHVALKYNELNKSLELVEYELSLMEKQLDTIEAVEAKYQQLIKKREVELLTNGTSEGKAILAISREIDARVVLLKDIEEAVAAGEKAMVLLKNFEKQLRKASEWGQWDMYGTSRGGGWMKHRAIDKARGYLHKVRHALIHFQNELKDVYADARIDADLRIERVDRFLDVFFDNLITDWIVQQKIRNAVDNLLNTKDQVYHAMERLEDEGPKVHKELEELEARREAVILGQ